nr:type II toxin-antitoxin system VapC family toxin [Pleomorphovibrio marinus]
MYELLMGAIDENKRKDIRLLTEDIPVLPFDENISKMAAEIYHQLRSENKMRLRAFWLLWNGLSSVWVVKA